MRWSGILVVLSVLVAASHADAQSTRSRSSKNKKSVELKTFMTTRGDLIFEDPLTEESFKKNWRVYKGRYTFDGGNLKVAEIASDGHHPAASRSMDVTDCIVQFSFRIDGAKWLGFAWDRKGDHVARAMIRPNGFRVQMSTGIGPTTKGYPIDDAPLKFEPGTWYTILIEIQGNEMFAQVDDKHVVFGGMKGLDREKTRVEFISGGEHAWFKDLKVWKALPNKRWPANKAHFAKQFKRSDRKFE